MALSTYYVENEAEQYRLGYADGFEGWDHRYSDESYLLGYSYGEWARILKEEDELSAARQERAAPPSSDPGGGGCDGPGVDPDGDRGP